MLFRALLVVTTAVLRGQAAGTLIFQGGDGTQCSMVKQGSQVTASCDVSTSVSSINGNAACCRTTSATLASLQAAVATEDKLLHAEDAVLRAEITALKGEVAALKGVNYAALEALVARLSARLNYLEKGNPCRDGSHGCEKTQFGMCIETGGTDYRCDCKRGYVTQNAHDPPHSAHTCAKVTPAPTPFPSPAPTPFPTPVPPTPFPTPAPTPLPYIRVTSATYGYHNCGGRGSNQTPALRGACNGKRSCNYHVSHYRIGDPAGGCPK
jgi:hypothetical protein